MSGSDNQIDPPYPNYDGSFTGTYEYDPQYSIESQSNLSIEELKEQQIKAIQEMRFEDADDLQQRIFNLSERQSNDIIKQYCDFLILGCDELAKEYSKRRRAALSIQNRNEINARRAITDEFIEKQNTQIHQLKLFEEDLFEQFKALMNRPIDKFDDLNKRALQAGFSGDFTLASELRDEAKDVQVKELKKRQTEFEEIYKKQVNSLLDKQRQELTELQQKLSQNVTLIEKQRKQMIDNESESFRKKIIRKYNRITRKVKVNTYDPVQARQADSVSGSVSGGVRSPSKRFGSQSVSSPSSASRSTTSEFDEGENKLPPVPLEMKKTLHKELDNTFKEICTRYRLTNIQESTI
ncbi:hypothetical protein M9Y10_008427 [Tritrichomonas musculus]|uniref:DUF4200 domain-containing protein n=1 Tax=Tritrichomonas musculus TaxID=1915356 RepID=A0ABR2IY54_9EUKA